MKIRKARLRDFEELYQIGLNTPELKVSKTEEFMDEDDFKWHIGNKNGVFLLAEEEKKVVGFICANAKDIEKPFENKYACMVYISVIPDYRGRGVAEKLYFECEARLKKMGVTYAYLWCNAKSLLAREFTKNLGYKEGHEYVWMDKKL